MSQSPRIILAAYGTPGVMGLESLFAEGVEPKSIALLTHASDDRNECLWSLARGHGLPIHDGAASSEETYQWVKGVGADALFSLHYRQRVPGRILSLFPMGGVNLHPALLPKYRGCFSGPWALINGEDVTGFSYHYMTEKFDEGRIVLQKEIPIRPDDTAFSLFHRQITEGLAVFSTVYRKVVVERNAGVPQTGEGSYYSRQVPFGGRIDPGWPEDQIKRFIRAMHFPPHRGAMLQIGTEEHEVNSWEDYQRLAANAPAREAGR